jgi:hypothetical protein
MSLTSNRTYQTTNTTDAENNLDDPAQHLACHTRLVGTHLEITVSVQTE